MAPNHNDESLEIDLVLGKHETRFLGAGYRRVSHSLQTVAHDSTTTTGIASIDYPSDWSITADTSGSSSIREPHLSSIDAITTTLQTIERHWPHSALDYVSRISLRAGARPWSALRLVPIEVRQVRTSPQKTHYEATVGNIRAWVDVLLVGPRTTSSPSSADFTRGYGRGTVGPLTRITHILDEPHTITATHTFSYPDSTTPSAGLGSAYAPFPTSVDYISAMGELSQVALDKGHGLARGSGEMWMKSLDLRMPSEPERMLSKVTSTAHATLERSIRTEHLVLSLLSASVTMSNGVTGNGKLAFTSPPPKQNASPNSPT